ncbi:hypothetical protein KEM56_000808 [Ascosphaera pollenicola]|nr:hypothetical protein KEM56_000808 [Ascosphaera pollenicola]
MGILNRRRPEDRQESQINEQPVAKENGKGPKRDRLKRGLTKDGFTSFLRPVQSNSSASSTRSASHSQDAAATFSDTASHRGKLSRSQTLPDITVQPPGNAPQQQPTPSSFLPKLHRTATVTSTTAGAAAATHEPTENAPRRPRSRFTPSLPNIRDTLKISKSTGRRKSSPAVPEVTETAAVETTENQPAPQQQTLDPNAAQGSWTPDQASHGSRPPSSPEMSAVGSIRSGRSRFFPSLQNIREHTGPALRLRSRTKNGNRSSVKTQTDDEVSPRPSKEMSRFPDFLLDRPPPGSRPSSAPGQLQEPKVDLLIRNLPPLPRMMDSSTQTEVAPEEPEQLELPAPLDVLPENVDAEAAIDEVTDKVPSIRGPLRLRDYEFKPSTPKRTMSLPSVVLHPGSFDKDTESYFVPRPRRASESSSYRQTNSVPPGSEGTPSPPTSTEVVSPMGTTLLTASAAWKSFNKANMAVKRQRQNNAATETREPAPNERLADLPIPDPPADMPVLHTRPSIRDQHSMVTQTPTPPPSVHSAGPGSRMSGTLFAKPDSTGTSSMSTSAGITAAVVGALAGAITVAARWSSPSSSAPDPTSIMSVGETSPFSSASVDARKIRKNEDADPFSGISFSQQSTRTTAPARQSLLEAAQSDVAWQKHWGYDALKQAQAQDMDTDGLEFDDELAAFQPDRPQKDIIRRGKGDNIGDDKGNNSSKSDSKGSGTADAQAQSANDASSKNTEPLKPLDPANTALERLSAILRHLKPSPSQALTAAASSGITEPRSGL